MSLHIDIFPFLRFVLIARPSITFTTASHLRENIKNTLKSSPSPATAKTAEKIRKIGVLLSTLKSSLVPALLVRMILMSHFAISLLYIIWRSGNEAKFKEVNEAYQVLSDP